MIHPPLLHGQSLNVKISRQRWQLRLSKAGVCFSENIHTFPCLVWEEKACFNVFSSIGCVLTATAGYWSRLASTTQFRGRMLEQCISIIHDDIIAIWNIQDNSQSVRVSQ